MKIGMIAPPWAPVPPQGYGGIASIINDLATGCTEAGHEVRLVTTGDSTCAVPRVETMPFSEGGRIGDGVTELRHALAGLDALRDCDVIHDHTVIGPFLTRGWDGPPLTATCHHDLSGELGHLYRRLESQIPVVAVSHAQRHSAPEVPVARVIHHGIEAERFPVGQGDGGYVMFLGRMAFEKGAHRALHAAHMAGARLVIAAKMREAEERRYFERYVEPYLNDDLRYVGEVGHDEKLALLANASALLFPIRWNEPFGLVMLEAMACGTPILAYAEGAAPEIVQDGVTGYLCDDEAAMAGAIDRIGRLDRSACRAVVEDYFSKRRMVDEHLAYYDAVIAGEADYPLVHTAGPGSDPGSEETLQNS
jgi:glycosyltransferase involved in cell wall biosynthesis